VLHPNITFSQLLIWGKDVYDFVYPKASSQDQSPKKWTSKRSRKKADEDSRERKTWAEKITEKRSKLYPGENDLTRYLPRVGDTVLGWCRDCGGPITERDPARRFLRDPAAFLSFYSGASSAWQSKWRDEAGISYRQSFWVCGACITAKSGSDRSWSHPSPGQAVLVELGKAVLTTLFEAVDRIAVGDIEPPFALLVGGVGHGNPEHCYRFVPLNWDRGSLVAAYKGVPGEYSSLLFRAKELALALADAKELVKANGERLLSGDSQQIKAVKQQVRGFVEGRRLLPAEEKLFNLAIIRLFDQPLADSNHSGQVAGRSSVEQDK
jgi:hypothetical protein